MKPRMKPQDGTPAPTVESVLVLALITFVALASDHRMRAAASEGCRATLGHKIEAAVAGWQGQDARHKRRLAAP